MRRIVEVGAVARIVKRINPAIGGCNRRPKVDRLAAVSCIDRVAHFDLLEHRLRIGVVFGLGGRDPNGYPGQSCKVDDRVKVAELLGDGESAGNIIGGHVDDDGIGVEA